MSSVRVCVVCPFLFGWSRSFFVLNCMSFFQTFLCFCVCVGQSPILTCPWPPQPLVSSPQRCHPPPSRHVNTAKSVLCRCSSRTSALWPPNIATTRVRCVQLTWLTYVSLCVIQVSTVHPTPGLDVLFCSEFGPAHVVNSACSAACLARCLFPFHMLRLMNPFQNQM